MLSDEQFERVRRLALSLAGIELVERHRELLRHRSRRAGIHDQSGLDALLQGAEAGDATARQRLLCLLTTKFTGFFRHPAHFRVAAEHALRAVSQRGRARLWSAGAATGEEAYSLAMAMIEAFGGDHPPVEVFATDIDANALSVARRGEYADAAVRTLTPGQRERFLVAAADPQRWAVAPAVRRLAEFRELNLVSDDWAVQGCFDVIFCRNVLMYLERGRRQAVVERMAELLVGEGLLLLDPAEHLGRAGHLFTAGRDGVFSRRGTSSR